jgi:hypothetical protein
MQEAELDVTRLPEHMKEKARKYSAAKGQRFWRNSKYTVAEWRFPLCDRDGNPQQTVVHLSIHDQARSANRDWRDFQRIKNDIIGAEEEAVELFPAETRLVDTSNEWHLWCILGMRWPFGYDERLVSEGGYQMGNSRQRKWSDGDRPADCRDLTEEEVSKLLTGNVET